MISSNTLYRFFFCLFFLVLFYDPAGLLEIKTPFFICLFFYSIYILRNQNISFDFFLYPLLFCIIACYGVIVAEIRFNNVYLYPVHLLLVKSFFSSFLIFLLLANKNYLKDLVLLINLVAFCTIFFLICLIFLFYFIYDYGSFIKIYEFGTINQIYYFEDRDFGFLNIKQLYFAVSPLILININFYFKEYFLKDKSFFNLFFLIINILAIIISGTRANILAFLILISLNIFFLINSDSLKKVFYIICLPFLIVILLLFFDISEYSNNIKIELMRNYFSLFYDFKNFLFGQGLGSYHNWGAYAGFDHYVTELTYFDILRSFGFIVGFLLIFLFISPLLKLFFTTKIKYKFYGSLLLSYLILSFFNPNLINFMGFLVFSICLIESKKIKNDF